MSLPGGSRSIEWMESTTKTMKKLQEKMKKLFPKEMSALLKKHPEVESVTWDQFSEAGFSLAPYEVNINTTKKKFNEKAFRKEVDRLLSPMPSAVLLSMYDHYCTITCTAEDVSSDFNGEGDFNSAETGIGRETPGKVEFTDSPLGECFTEYYELRDRAKESIEKLAVEFVASHNEIKAMRWVQYTPGFMDGELCEFSVGSVFVMLEGSSEYSHEWADLTKAQQKAVKEAREFINKIHDDILYAQYGDHVEITVTNKKVTTTEYLDHD